MCQIFRVMFRIREAYIFCFIFPCLRCYTGSYCTIEINSKEVSAFYFLFIFSHSEATVRAMADQVQFVKTFFSQHSVVTIIIAYTVPTSESGFKNSNHDINSFWIKSYVGQARLIVLKLSPLSPLWKMLMLALGSKIKLCSKDLQISFSMMSIIRMAFKKTGLGGTRRLEWAHWNMIPQDIVYHKIITII